MHLHKELAGDTFLLTANIHGWLRECGGLGDSEELGCGSRVVSSPSMPKGSWEEMSGDSP